MIERMGRLRLRFRRFWIRCIKLGWIRGKGSGSIMGMRWMGKGSEV